MYFAISWAVGVQFLIVCISLDLYFHYLSNAVFEIVLLQKLAKIQRKENRKSKMMAQFFFIFWIHSIIFCDFLGCRCSILISEIIIRFVFPLAFQCHIPSYSTAKTREDMAKRKRKVENDCSAFLHFLDSFKHISRFLGLQTSDFLMFLYH